MQPIRKAFITNCILMGVCAILLAYNILMFRTTYDLLHSNNLSAIIAILLIPIFFLFSLGSVVMGIIQVSIAVRNIIKVRAWYTVLLLVISCLIVIAPIVMVSLIFLL